MATREEMLTTVKAYVLAQRIKQGVSQHKLRHRQLVEGSCYVNGEFYNLVETQLVHTIDGYGGWQELQFPELLEGCYNYVVFGKRGY